MRNTLTVALVILGVILGVIIGSNLQSYNDTHADITVLPCALWGGNSDPVIPAYTFTGACVLPDGYLSVPPDPNK